MGQVNTPSNLIDRINDLQRQIDAVRKQVGINSATISSGGLTVQDGGSFRLLHPNGTEIARIGDLAASVDGNELWGTRLFRPDGSLALEVRADEEGGNQVMAILDRSGNTILADDNTSGQGLAVPYMPYPVPSSEVTSLWPSTTSTSFTTIADVYVFATHPRIEAYVLMSGSGSVRLMVGGTQVGDTVTGNAIIGGAVPGWGDTVGFQDAVLVELQAKASSGTVRASTQYLYGRQS